MNLKVKHIGLSVFTVFLVSAMLWLTTKISLTFYSSQKANKIIEQAYASNPANDDDQKIIALSHYVYKNFNKTNPSKDFALRIRGYVTNKRLPKILRLESGVIETIFQKGLCDNASRMLSFILKNAGYNSIQWNMIGDTSGHSALLVTLPHNRTGFVDPFYGYIAQKNGKLISAEQAQEFLHTSNKDPVLIPLNENSNHEYYKDFKNLMMAAEGDSLHIHVKIPKLNGQEIILGEINNNFVDVKRDARNLKMTPYWHYLGHKYNREWVRTLEATEDVEITMTLMLPPEQGVITSNIKPEANDNQLIWNLRAGEKLSLIDAKAQISLKRRNSFIDVDQIKFAHP